MLSLPLRVEFRYLLFALVLISKQRLQFFVGLYYLLVDVTAASAEADDRCNRLEARSWGLPVAALVSTSELCFDESISSIDRLRPTIIVLVVFPLVLRMRLAFICLRGDGDKFFLLRACFRLLDVEWVVVLEVDVVEEEEERLMEAEDGTRLTFGILSGRISFCPSSSLSSSPDSYRILSRDNLKVSL